MTTPEELDVAYRARLRELAVVGSRVLIGTDAPCQAILGFITGMAADSSGVFTVVFSPKGETSAGRLLSYEKQIDHHKCDKIEADQWCVWERPFQPSMGGIFG